ncbi:hypothetical protein ACJX0J_040538, partial [Zea mays]
SFLDRKDKFKLWMASADWENSDQQKSVSISSFLPKMMSAMAKIRSSLGDDPINKNLCDRLMQVINRRLDYMLNDTHMLAESKLCYLEEKMLKIQHLMVAQLRIQHFETDMESLEQMKNSKDRNIDPCSIMIDVAMYDEGNPIMEWIGSSRENGRKRNVVEEDIGDDFLSDSIEGGGSPTYNESGDSDSNDGGGDDEDGEPSGPCFVARTQPKLATNQYNGPGQDEQTAPLRPRSKRQKKLSIKGLYMLEK